MAQWRFFRNLTERERDIEDEIQAHLQLAVQDRVRSGETPEDASRSARRELGNTTLIQEIARDSWAWSWLDRLGRDFRHALRSLMRTAGSTTACIVTLSLGIGAATAMFALVDSLLLRPLPYPEPEQFAAIEPAVSWGDALDIERYAHTVQDVAVYRKRTFGFTDASQKPVEVVLAGMVTHRFFDILGVYGTGFTREQEIPGANHTIWLTDEFRQRRYGNTPPATGTTVRLNEADYRVAGVLPAGFRFPMDGENPDVYIPLDAADYCCRPETRTLGGIVRLGDHASRGAAAAELSAISSWSYRLVRLQSGLLGDRERALILPGLAAVILLLVAATNAASILLARAMRNSREAAIKASLGADRKHLIIEHAAQGVVIAVAAAVTGLAMATAVIRAARFAPVMAKALEPYAKTAPLEMDGRIVASAVLTALVSSVGAAVVPVFLAGHSRPGRAARVRNLLVIFQIAFGSILLCTGTLIFDHLQKVLNADKGFRTDQIVIAGIGIPEKRYDTDAKMIGFHERVTARLAGLPGVIAAGAGAGLPLGMRTQFEPEGQNTAEKDRPSAMVGAASPDLLGLLGITVLQGRGFTTEDRYGHPWRW
jgi:predicted permease